MKNEIERIRAEWRAVEACWRESREGWNDSVAWGFEREFWEPLSQAAAKMFRESESLSDRLENVVRRSTF